MVFFEIKFQKKSYFIKIGFLIALSVVRNIFKFLRRSTMAMFSTTTSTSTKPSTLSYLNDGKDIYSSAEMAAKFNSLTGEHYTAKDVENKFGKSYVTDSDLYFMLEGKNGTTADGKLLGSEVNHFMGKSVSETTPPADFKYWQDNKAQYSVTEIAQQIAQMTGKQVNPADIAALVGGKQMLSDFDVLVLMDKSRDGVIKKEEVDNFITASEIETTPSLPTMGTSYIYQGDGLWSYSAEDFMSKIKNSLGITLTEEQVKSRFMGDDGVFRLDDRILKNMIDANKDGKLSQTEINTIFPLAEDSLIEKTATYIGDGKSNYTPVQVANALSHVTGKTISEAEVNAITGGKKTITDYDMFQLFDVNRDGKVSTKEAQRLLTDGALETDFKYLNDVKTSYTPTELSKELSKIGIIATPTEIQQKFGKSVITDNDIFNLLDKVNPQTGYKDGVLKQEDVRRSPIPEPFPRFGITPLSNTASNPYLKVLLGGQETVLGQNPQLDMMRYMTGNIQMM